MNKRNRNKSRSRNRKVSYQSLEPRKMLAGDVVAFQHGEHFFIRGDAEANEISISVEEGKMVIDGLNETTVNGLQRVVIEESNFIDSDEANSVFEGGLRVNLGGGDDVFSIRDAEIHEKSVVYGGAGHDQIEFHDTVFHERLLVQTYTGDDSVLMTGSELYGDFYAFTLEGNDSFHISDSMNESSSVVVTGDGDDHVMLADNHYMGHTQLVLTLDGNDVIEVMNPTVGSTGLGVFAGHGKDHFAGHLSAESLGGEVTLAGQLGDDISDMVMPSDGSSMVDVRTIEDAVVWDSGSGAFDQGLYAYRDSIDLTGNLHAAQFQFDEATSISTIEWGGTYPFTFVHDDVADRWVETFSPPETHAFVIQVFEDIDGAPADSPIYTSNIGNDVVRTDGAVIATQGELEQTLFEFSAEVDMAFDADQTYWFSIYEDTFDPIFGIQAFVWSANQDPTVTTGNIAGRYFYDGDSTDPNDYKTDWAGDWYIQEHFTELAMDFTLRT